MRMVSFVLASICLLTACTRQPSNQIPLSASERVEHGQLKNINLVVSRTALFKALELGAPINNIRLVPVFRGSGGSSSTEDPAPEYRFFDVNPKSGYYLLGIRTNDVLVSVEDHILYKPQNFPEYVRRLLDVQRGWIEIRRGGEAMLLSYTMQ